MVDIFHQTVPVDMSQSSCLFKGASRDQTSAPRKRSFNHQCGGTLLVLNDDSGQKWSNKVYTASHCFCKLGFDRRCHWAPDPKHFFVRIGLLDNTKALNPTWTKDYPGELIQPKDDDEYIDVRVTSIKLQGKKWDMFTENRVLFIKNRGIWKIIVKTSKKMAKMILP